VKVGISRWRSVGRRLEVGKVGVMEEIDVFIWRGVGGSFGLDGGWEGRVGRFVR
jgi:hypothetical protein